MTSNDENKECGPRLSVTGIFSAAEMRSDSSVMSSYLNQDIKEELIQHDESGLGDYPVIGTCKSRAVCTDERGEAEIQSQFPGHWIKTEDFSADEERVTEESDNIGSQMLQNDHIVEQWQTSSSIERNCNLAQKNTAGGRKSLNGSLAVSTCRHGRVNKLKRKSSQSTEYIRLAHPRPLKHPKKSTKMSPTQDTCSDSKLVDGNSSPGWLTVNDVQQFKSIHNAELAFPFSAPTMHQMVLQSQCAQPIPAIASTSIIEDSPGQRDQNPHILNRIYQSLDQMMLHLQRLEAKVDTALNGRSSNMKSSWTQTELLIAVPPRTMDDSPSEHQLTPDPTINTEPVFAVFKDDSPEMPTPEKTPPSEDIFVCDEKFWHLYPQQLESMQISPGHLDEVTRDVDPTVPYSEDRLNIDEGMATYLLQRSHSASHLAKNILYNCFRLKELYNKNAYGKIFRANGMKKTPLNRHKMKALLEMVKIHYDGPWIEKTVTGAVNSALRHLWGRKLKHSWLVF